MKKIRVLSLDGGGMRGIIPATVLAYVETKLQEISKNKNARIADYFDIVVGTSTGGILSCFYLTPNLNSKTPSTKYEASDALAFYTKEGINIFNNSKKKLYNLRRLINAVQYNPNIIERIFKDKFGDIKYSELVKPCLVPTYNLKTRSAFFFNRDDYKNKDKSKHRDFLLRDVARSTSAAPTYFPPARINNLIGSKDEMINIDGGVFANNPAMCAYAECRDTEFNKNPNPKANDMLILSLGTGAGMYELPNIDKSNSWGVLNWAKLVPEVMMDGSIDTVHYQLKQIFDTLGDEDKKNYKRVNVPTSMRRKYSSNMAEASEGNVAKLRLAGQQAIDAAQKKKEDEHTLDKFIQLLVDNHS